MRHNSSVCIPHNYPALLCILCSLCSFCLLCSLVAPVPYRRILCRHPFDANRRVYVTPSRVQALHSCYWDGALTRPFDNIRVIRARVQQQLASFREDHLRRLNPTPYKLSVTSGRITILLRCT